MKSKSSKPKLLEPAWQTQMRERVATKAEPIANQYLGSLGEMYGGDVFASPTYLQNWAFNQSENIANTPMASESKAFQSGMGEIEKVLSGDYNPEDSLYYQSFRNALQRELEGQMDMLANRSSSRDRFFGGGRMDQEREMSTDYLNNLGMTLGQLQEAERQRMFSAIPMAAQLSQFQAMEPFQRAHSAIGLGELQRALMQEQIDRQYQDWMRSRGELGAGLDTVMGMSTFKPDYYMKSSGGGGLGDMLGGIGSLLGGAGSLAGGLGAAGLLGGSKSSPWAGMNSAPGFGGMTPSGTMFA